jgi:hypothetical protein
MITDKNFRDWESDTFGFGYGTGEQYVLPSLKTFLNLCNEGPSCSYDYKILESQLSPAVTWLLINILASNKVDIIEYGTSPRFAWLTEKGKLLKEYVDSKTEDELYEIATAGVVEFDRCSRDFCNCEAEHKRCNPLF